MTFLLKIWEIMRILLGAPRHETRERRPGANISVWRSHQHQIMSLDHHHRDVTQRTNEPHCTAPTVRMLLGVGVNFPFSDICSKIDQFSIYCSISFNFFIIFNLAHFFKNCIVNNCKWKLKKDEKVEKSWMKLNKMKISLALISIFGVRQMTIYFTPHHNIDLCHVDQRTHSC